MYKNPKKVVQKSPMTKWRVASMVLFVASLLSIFGGLILTNIVSNINGLFVENMWAFFLFTPVPVASIVFGFALKSKGYKYKKNIITGFIIFALLCIYGSFVFMF